MKLLEFGFLLVDDFGVLLKKKRKRVLVISKEGKKEFPVKNLREVIISGKASISSELIKHLALSGIDILFTTPTGKPIARVVNTRLGGTAENRKEQYKSLDDERCIYISKSVIIGKIRNQFSNLRYYSKSRRATKEIAMELYGGYEKLKEKSEELSILEISLSENWRETILSYEGEAAKIYWQLLSLILKEFGFEKRERESEDPVNILLNVAYNMLSSQIWKYVLKFGLDPYCGFLHTERPGKLSLVYDLMEPYRPMVDRFVISFIKHCDKRVFSSKEKAIPLLLKEFIDKFLNSRIEYKGRKMRIETTMFYYLQEIVAYIRRNKENITTPFIPW